LGASVCPVGLPATGVLVGAGVSLGPVARRLDAEERPAVIGREQGEIDDQQRERRSDDLGREELAVHVGRQLTPARAWVRIAKASPTMMRRR
jgi:hypothetical protein